MTSHGGDLGGSEMASMMKSLVAGMSKLASHGEEVKLSTPHIKRLHLCYLASRLMLGGKTDESMITRLVALFIHPFMHRRELMACFHRIFRWKATLPQKGSFVIPADIKAEIVGAALMLPFAVANIRAPISTTISVTDATPLHGGPVRSNISRHLAHPLYNMCEHRVF